MTTSVVSEMDFSKPIVVRKQMSAHSDGNMRLDIDYGEFGHIVTDEPVAHGGTGTGPSPLQAVLGALCGCETVTFNRTATDLGFSYEAIDWEGAFTIDIRGRMGMREIRPHFQTIRVQATVTTNESEERLREVVEETEKRCPVYNLLRDADVNVKSVWIRKPSGSSN